MSSAPYRTWVEVSRERIAANFRAVRSAVGPGVEVVPVVKADAYRHGAVEVSRILEREGAKWLAVSSVEEGVTLRQAGIAARILVMADFLAVERPALLEFDLTPVIHSLEDLAELERLAERASRPARFHLKVDTGMGRLGTPARPEAILAAIGGCRYAQLEGLMTHFASAAIYTSDQTDRQIAEFDALLACLEGAGIRPRYLHMASTVSIAYPRRQAWRNMVRPGQAIYGYVSPVRGPAPKSILSVQPAMEWKAAVLQVKEVPAGAEIGYGAMFRAPRAMKIGILAVGYADGFPHRLSGWGRVIVKGSYASVVGAVSMDLTTVDLTGIAEVHPGDVATLLGRQDQACVDAHEIARLAGTISYAVLCGISARVKRVYL